MLGKGEEATAQDDVKAGWPGRGGAWSTVQQWVGCVRGWRLGRAARLQAPVSQAAEHQPDPPGRPGWELLRELTV